MTEWLRLSEHNPFDMFLRRIIVLSKSTGKIHIVHHDYGYWLLDETDNGSAGEDIQFDYWMPLPKLPEVKDVN